MRRAALLLLLLAACKREGAADPRAPFRLGYFPNLTHAQALVGEDDGTFRRALGDTPLSLKKFNAGPEAMQALLAGELDATYVGSGPAINAFVQSKGALRVVAGAASGGAGLYTRHARSPAELRDQKLASPQLGNSQDIALRYWLQQNGLRTEIAGGGDVAIVPVTNADILNLFKRGDIEGAWVPEPWGSRLVSEAGAQQLVDERDLWPERTFPTTVLVASRRALLERPGQIEALVRAHLALTEQARKDRLAFGRRANQVFGRITGHPLPPQVLRRALGNIDFTADPMTRQLQVAARHAFELGFLPTADVSALVDERILARERAVGGSGKHP